MTRTVRLIIVVLVTLIASACTAEAAKPITCVRKHHWSVEGTNGHINLIVDSIDFRSDLTRVYAVIIGKPHTANRIDRMTMKLIHTPPYDATDIDGIDLQRWFQWEDSGRIPVEIDFPPVNPSYYNNGASRVNLMIDITAKSAYGICWWKINPK